MTDDDKAKAAARRRGGGLWFAAMAVLVGAGVAVPYGILSGGAAAGWTFAFWTVFGVAVAAMIWIAVAGWRDAA